MKDLPTKGLFGSERNLIGTVPKSIFMQDCPAVMIISLTGIEVNGAY